MELRSRGLARDALKAACGEVVLYVAYAKPEGWPLGFVGFAAGRDTSVVVCEALPSRGTDSMVARAVRPARADTDLLLRAARAFTIVRDALGAARRPYNLTVFLDTAGEWGVRHARAHRPGVLVARRRHRIPTRE